MGNCSARGSFCQYIQLGMKLEAPKLVSGPWDIWDIKHWTLNIETLNIEKLNIEHWVSRRIQYRSLLSNSRNFRLSICTIHNIQRLMYHDIGCFHMVYLHLHYDEDHTAKVDCCLQGGHGLDGDHIKLDCHRDSRFYVGFIIIWIQSWFVIKIQDSLWGLWKYEYKVRLSSKLQIPDSLWGL